MQNDIKDNLLPQYFTIFANQHGDWQLTGNLKKKKKKKKNKQNKKKELALYKLANACS